MRLTHLDILEQCFHEKFRGYHKKEVETFLHLVAEDYQEMDQEIQSLKSQLAAKLNHIETLEEENKNLQETINNGSDSQKAPNNGSKQSKGSQSDETHIFMRKGKEELDLLKKDIMKLKDERENLLENIKVRARNYVQSLKKSGDLPSRDVSANQKM
ncbi:MAG: DivIVA domain-containing protein [Nitrospinales bacterium]